MELDDVRLATPDDLTQLCNFYKNVCDHQSLDEYSAKFTWGDYPSEQGLRSYLENAQVMIGLLGDKIVGAGVLTIGEEYPDVNWPEKFESAEIGVIHLYALQPSLRGQGMSGVVLEALINQAKKNGLKAIHLDVLGGNIPAAKLYLKHGFQRIIKQIYHYDDLGDYPAVLMEYLL